MIHQHRYGHIVGRHDPRDFTFKVEAPISLPPAVDLRTTGFLPAVYDQKTLGSCTAQAIAAAYAFESKKQGEDFDPSRLFIYFNERDMEGTINEDSGAQIRDGVKSINTLGVCPETEWPYILEVFATRPSAAIYTSALDHQALQYYRVAQTEQQIKTALASGFPICFGFTVYESFESQEVAASGIMPMPNEGEQCLGGHAVLLCGYDDATKMFLVRNSWSSDWGIGGYFWMPFEFVFNPSQASDFWVVQRVE